MAATPKFLGALVGAVIEKNHAYLPFH
jgi:hypothetical protein